VKFGRCTAYCIMDELLDYLSQFAKLSHSDVSFIAGHVQEVSLARDDYFLDIDEIPASFCFVKSGVLRTGCYNSGGEEVTKRFIVEHRFLSDVYAFDSCRPSPEFVQAALDSTLITFTMEAVRHLSAVVGGWETMMARIAIRVLNERDSFVGKPPGTSAASRYVAFERSYPGLVDRIGLCHIASYLGVSTSTLSRIRRKPGRSADFDIYRRYI